MKAAVMVKMNSPLEIRDVKDPIPQGGQVLIKIHACGVCGTDVHVHEGTYHRSMPFPLIAGHEPVGEIVQLGEGVTSLKVGDRVGVSWVQKGCGRCGYCQERRPLYCDTAQTWVQVGGGNAEYMLAWADGCTLLPEGLSYEEAAPLFCAGYTIASGFYNAQPKPGERVAILGLGGLGHLAVQFCKAKGMFTMVVTRTADKIDLAKKLGADEVVVAEEHAGKALAKAGGAHIILNTGNSSKLAVECLEGLLPEGRLVLMGIDPEPMMLPQSSLITKQLKLIGSRQDERQDLIDILNLAAQGKVKPMIEVFSLAEVNTAFERVKSGKVRFRAVLRP
jgi:2-desacetyl-2-hydroxyethyl bacteriochlorophyllide A dehydrogenase